MEGIFIDLETAKKLAKLENLKKKNIVRWKTNEHSKRENGKNIQVRR